MESWSGRYEVMGQYARSDIVLESNSLLRAVFFIPKNKERQVTVMRQAVTTVQYVFAGIGGFMGWFLGGLDGFLYALLMFVVIDYVTGLMAAFVQKKVSSEVGFKGICKKVAIFCLVGIGHVDVYKRQVQEPRVLRILCCRVVRWQPHGFPMCQSRCTPLMHRRCKDGVYSICWNNQYT